MADEFHSTRRGVLAIAGATALAGCGAFGFGGEDDPVELDGSAVASVASGDLSSVADPLPVDVADSHVAASRERAESLLDSVPLPLSADEIPNGAMREELHRHAEEAREQLTAASEAPGTRPRLDRLRSAREPARTVDAAWAFANDDLAMDDVRASAKAVRDETSQFREEWEYVGADPVRALIVHDVVESWAGDARHYAEPDDRGEPSVVNAVGAGERAGEVERGRAHLQDARYVGEQFADSLSDPQSLRSTFTDARSSLASTVESRMADLPGRDADLDDLVDADVADTVAGEAIRDLHRHLPHWEASAPDDALANGVLERVSDLAHVGAFESLRDRVEGGEQFEVESANDVRALRSTAVAAIEDARDASDDQRLARTVLADLRGWLAYADENLQRYRNDGTIKASYIRREVAAYVEIAAIADATPEACAEGLDALGVE